MNRIFLFLLIALLTLGACDKLPENGPLDGQWQLMEIATRQSPDDADFSLREAQKDNRIYWCFQLKLLSIRTLTGSLNGHTDETVGRFRYTGDRLAVTELHIHYRARDSLVTDPSTTAFERLGITGCADTFQIERLDGQQMVLRSADRRLTFRKF